MNVKRIFSMALTALLATAIFSTAAWSKKELPPPPEPPGPVCSLAGSWVGDAEGDLGWLGIHTSMDGTKGEMLMNWIYDYLIPNFSYELLPGTGVWELIDSDIGTYSFTWYSLIKPSDQAYPNLPVRVSGTAQMQDCDNVTINYLFEILDEYGWNNFDTGTASETRLPMYTPPVSP